MTERRRYSLFPLEAGDSHVAASSLGGFPHPEEGRRPVSKDEEIPSAPHAIAPHA